MASTQPVPHASSLPLAPAVGKRYGDTLRQLSTPLSKRSPSRRHARHTKSASPCEATLRRRHHKEFEKQLPGKQHLHSAAGLRASYRLRLRLTMPRPPLKLFFPANVVARNRAEALARAALQELREREAQAQIQPPPPPPQQQQQQQPPVCITIPRPPLKIRFDAHNPDAAIRAETLAREALAAMNATEAWVLAQALRPPMPLWAEASGCAC
jgi:hypothetical protein